VPVLNRYSETMIRAITDNVHPGTKIITDQWRAYDAAMNHMTQYSHETINHSVNFVNPTKEAYILKALKDFGHNVNVFSEKA
jgi:hypothetical protein